MVAADAQNASDPSHGTDEILRREVAYHDRLYAGEAQRIFAGAAARALRLRMVGQMLAAIPGDTSKSRVLSVGCGIGDTELLLARHVAEVVGLDLSARAIEQAGEDAARKGIENVRFLHGTAEQVALEAGSFDAVVAIFFLHHLPAELWASFFARTHQLLRPGAVFYALDPNRRRLSGAIGRRLLPRLMARYQSPDERPLDPGATRRCLEAAGYECRTRMFDFVSTPCAGLLPRWGRTYRCARWLDDLLLRLPLIGRLGSNFEVLARSGLASGTRTR